ncbi:hypothetical protein C5167_028832 [Papaver somniferum]|uniref:probable glucuronoxylan glucuronosyltransferase IRX7 isoform X1 n=2 Tax=Papaver somniferum TaxID=3469 RepID=UPI000E704B84|nr:probable glucuronoxylan glucuronosyltransferase IRX7 isoform X1 [Papaver somniferum]RZC90995.1 hypothetical protein C5167_028832 [Papaver somniferum]
MSEFNKLRISKNRGFYNVKMMNRDPHHHQNSNNNHKRSYYFYRYFKWVLWISFSLYFFTSFLITINNNMKPISSLSKTTIISTSTNPSSSVISRALFEDSSVQKPKSIPSATESEILPLKVYIYDLPSKYNTDWLTNRRCSNHLFASEVAIHKALLNSDVRTLNPFEADFFFVPVYVSCNFNTSNGFPSLGHARPLIKSAIQFVSESAPFWNRSQGEDHVFVASHDYGACFHPMEDIAIEDGIPSFLKKSIILQTFGVRFRHPCQEVENIVIPPYVSPHKIHSTLKHATNGKRDIFAFFRGKMELHPKNINGRIYSKGIRTKIWKKFSRNRKFYLKRRRYDGYQSEIVRSVFCLCPLGWAPWSPRLVESVALGCIPVIIADNIRLPYSDKIQWSKISLTVPEKDVNKLATILEHVAATNLTTIQKNLWDPSNQRALLFNEFIQPGDATWQLLDSLSKMLHLSHREPRLQPNHVATREIEGVRVEDS